MEKSFLNIISLDDFWSFTNDILIDSIQFQQTSTSSNTIDKLMENDIQLLSPPRFRQLQVKNNSCNIPIIFQNKFKVCYAQYSSGNEDKSPLVRDDLKWEYNDPETNSNEWYSWDQFVTYSGGGYIQELSRNILETKEIITRLKKVEWINSGTRAVFIEFAVYNKNSNLFCSIM